MNKIAPKILALILTFISFLSCTEKVSDDVEAPKLSQAEESKAQFKNKAIRLLDKNRPDLSFMLHRAGSMSAPCEVLAPTNGFSSAAYDKTSKVYTADCILDVEELDLFFHGAQFEFQVDEFLCEYINYKPYRFYGFQPGSSSKTNFKIECDDTCSEDHPAVCGKTYKTNATALPEGDINPVSLPGFFDNEYLVELNPMRCQYDYSGRFEGTDIEGPNCDEGSIVSYTYTLSSKEGAPGSFTCGTLGSLQLEEPTVTKCGGKIGACLAGPGADLLDSRESAEQLHNPDLKFLSKDYSVEAPSKKDYLSNIYAANYSRLCSSTGEVKTADKFDTSLFNIIGHEAEDAVFNNSKQIYSHDSDGDGRIDYTAYALHPFNSPAFRQSLKPYYAFECLDKAADIKAQIRLFIREWDRKFEKTNPYVARLSDINQAIPLMDASGLQAVGEIWNDRIDWDDIFEDFDQSNHFGPINGVQKGFLNNQCASLELGFCTDRTFNDEVLCIANGVCSDVSFTTELTCVADNKSWAPHVWKMESYCENPTFLTQNSCDSNGEHWVELTNINEGAAYAPTGLFPSYNL